MGYYQTNPEFGNVSGNLDRIKASLEPIEADLLVLPELCASGYQFLSREEAYDLAEPVPDGPTTRRLLELAKRKNLFMVAGLPERCGSVCYNSAVLVGPQGFLGCYRKTHLFFEETLFFAPGDTGFQAWNLGGVTVGIMICFDWYYPESARTLALKGADIICHPSNLVLPNCPDSMPVRCLENRVFAITCNRVGRETRGGKPPLTYIGNSEIVSPMGDILHRAPGDQEHLCVVDINPADARNKAVTPYNDLFRDRRESLYK